MGEANREMGSNTIICGEEALSVRRLSQQAQNKLDRCYLDEFFEFQPNTFQWKQIWLKGDKIDARSNHAAVVVKGK